VDTIEVGSGRRLEVELGRQVTRLVWSLRILALPSIAFSIFSSTITIIPALQQHLFSTSHLPHYTTLIALANCHCSPTNCKAPSLTRTLRHSPAIHHSTARHHPLPYSEKLAQVSHQHSSLPLKPPNSTLKHPSS
jgi:hypothetical protein